MPGNLFLSQMKLLPLGLDNVILMSDEAKKKAYETAHSGGAGGVNSKDIGEGKGEAKKERKLKFGELEFEALMRSLDNSVSAHCHYYRETVSWRFKVILISGLPHGLHLPSPAN